MRGRYVHGYSLAGLREASYAGGMLHARSAIVVLWLVAIGAGAVLSGCGGARTRMIEGHTVVLEGTHEQTRIAVDGVRLRVVYSPTEDRYRSPGCDFGSAATVDSLAEQMATSPTTCEHADGE